MDDFRRKELLKGLDDNAKLNSIICIRVCDNEAKEAVLNHMIKKGWVCVQNSVCCTEFLVNYILTFTTKDAAASFKV